MPEFLIKHNETGKLRRQTGATPQAAIRKAQGLPVNADLELVEVKYSIVNPNETLGASRDFVWTDDGLDNMIRRYNNKL